MNILPPLLPATPTFVEYTSKHVKELADKEPTKYTDDFHSYPLVEVHEIFPTTLLAANAIFGVTMDIVWGG